MSGRPTTLADGRYQVLDVLGSGGMATVYRAFDRWLQVHRAVKVLSPQLARSRVLQERFRIEARTMAQLDHPHIVAVHDVGTHEQGAFIVMELVDGGTLTDPNGVPAMVGPFDANAAAFTVHLVIVATGALIARRASA